MKKELTEEQKEAKKLYKREYYLKNKQRIKEYLLKNKEEISKKANERTKKWLENNKEKRNNYLKEYSIKNSEKIKQYQKNYKSKNDNREKAIVYSKLYYNENKEELLVKQKEYAQKNKNNRNIYLKNRKNTDPKFKLICSLRSTIATKLKQNGFLKTGKTRDILGCNSDELKQYLESKFQSWMNWENHGLYNGTEGYGWDIDHILPLSSAKTEEELIKLFHHTNLQPLCSYTNRYIKKYLFSF